MPFYVGIDDTDILGTAGTNQLARWLIERLAPRYRSLVAIRHQLLFDRRIPYTSKNSSASMLFEPIEGGLVNDGGSIDDLFERLRAGMSEWFVEGSDPGLCVAQRVPEEITAFGRRCQQEIVSQRDARELADRHGIRLEGLGGTQDGVIGALAAVGLVAGGDDGRVVSLLGQPDDLAGPQDIELLFARGVAKVQRVETGELVRAGRVDVGKHLRPSYRGKEVVLFVTPPAAADLPWQAVRLL
jgi:hypothetical protein